jgi:hypothetical protein
MLPISTGSDLVLQTGREGLTVASCDSETICQKHYLL